MKVGAMFPTRELPTEPSIIAAWVDAVVAAGFDHIIAADHVLGVDPAGGGDYAAAWPHPTDFRGAYTHEHIFHEPFVLFGFMAARCDLELVTGVLVLAQRQTVLVAKQAAEVDVLSGGRLRLGVGVGWNVREFEALRMPFDQRGRLFEEQLDVLRRLWTEPVVTYEGEFHTIRSSGLQMLPVQRPIPLWLGGDAPRVLRRIGRLGDGWYCNARERPGEEFDRKLATIRAAAREAGRDPDQIGVEPRQIIGLDDAAFAADVERWQQAGITHLAVDTMNVGRSSLAEHVDALKRASAMLGLAHTGR